MKIFKWSVNILLGRSWRKQNEKNSKIYVKVYWHQITDTAENFTETLIATEKNASTKIQLQADETNIASMVSVNKKKGYEKKHKENCLRKNYHQFDQLKTI